ncbi:GNAT family N-acetyltransferase [Saccharothrix variisporea]|uniref:L-amino acid N-acyltransferase YncA n=1 Tax=Saccharothrix variisporea TaxID=543527 RepID=A0A495X9J5_9PSEU|nr:GNAT family N-acetyltransferase [Saccharothrix variisporea]RKT70046.1 L-amino acid N-acyltransferase YncA [Saccharothrix variisporea]
MGLLIRTPDQDDMPAVAEVHFRARRSYYEGHVPEAELAEWEAGVRANGYRLGRFADRVWQVAEDGGKVVGFALVTPDGKLLQLQVDPAHWGRGVGSALHEWCVAEFRATGVRRAELDVFVENHRARRFYERQGWRAVGRDDDHVLMALDVSQQPVG